MPASQGLHGIKVTVPAGVIEVLTEGLKEKNERVRRRIMATLGELLFYVATQQQVLKHISLTPAVLMRASFPCKRKQPAAYVTCTALFAKFLFSKLP